MPMNVEERIKELGIKLPEAPGYKGNYIGAKWAGNIAFSCGQGPANTTKRGMVRKDTKVQERLGLIVLLSSSLS